MNSKRTQRCQCANHNDSYTETIPEARKSNVLVDAAHGSSEGFTGLTTGVELADHDICWMRHNGTQYTSWSVSAINKSDQRPDCQPYQHNLRRKKQQSECLFRSLISCQAYTHISFQQSFRKRQISSWYTEFVDPIEGKDLCRACVAQSAKPPNQIWASCSPSSAFLSRDCRDSTEGPRSKGRNCGLHSHLDSLKRTKRYISDKLGRSAGGEIQPGLVFVCILFSSQVGVKFLEILVSAVFECTLRLSPMSTVIAASLLQSIPSSQTTLDSTQ